MEDRILTRHPAGKKGVNILYRRYAFIRKYIIETVRSEGEISFSDLCDKAVDEISDTFDGKVLWYIATVKLDLEARGEIERIPKVSPHRLRIKTEESS
jgi:hypothetical protein